jgi:hypothetical protein
MVMGSITLNPYIFTMGFCFATFVEPWKLSSASGTGGMSTFVSWQH